MSVQVPDWRSRLMFGKAVAATDRRPAHDSTARATTLAARSWPAPRRASSLRAVTRTGAARSVRAGWVADGLAVALGRDQELDAGAGGAAEDVVRGVLVGPRRPQARRTRHLEDGVHVEVGVRVDRLAGLRVDRQFRRVDE